MAVSELLLKLRGESDGADRTLADVSRDLAAFGRQSATAEAGIETSDARTSLDRLEERLRLVDGKSVDPKVNLQIGNALARAQALKARLEAIDGQTATGHVDIKTRTAAVREIGAITSQIEKLDSSFKATGAQVEQTGAQANATTSRMQVLGAAISALSGKTAPATDAIKRLEQQLADLDGQTVSADADVRIGGALARLEALKARLRSIDGQRATGHVDIKTRTAAVSEIASVTREIEKLDGAFRKTGSDVDRTGQKTARMQTALLGLVAVAGTAAGKVARVATVFGVLSAAAALAVAGLGAVGGSAAAAVAGIGAMGVALAGAGAVAGVFGLAVARAFKKNINGAKAVKAALTSLKATFQHTTAPGVRAFLHQLAPAIRSLRPEIRSLKPAFTSFGRSAGVAVQTVVAGLKQLDPEIRHLIIGSGGLFRALAPAVAPLLGILLDIANAAMPHLIAQAGRIAAKLGTWRLAMQGGVLQATIAMLVTHFRLWLGIIGSVTRGLASMFVAAEPQIRAFVGWIAKGAQNFARWAASAAGRQQIRTFLAQALPMLQRLIGLVGKVGQLWAAWAPIIKPVLDAVISVVTWIVQKLTALGNAITRVTGKWGPIGGAARTAIGVAVVALLTLGGPIAGLIGKIAGISTALRAIRWMTMASGIGPAVTSVLARLAGVKTGAGAAGAGAGTAFGSRLMMALRVIPIAAAATALWVAFERVGLPAAKSVGSRLAQSLGLSFKNSPGWAQSAIGAVGKFGAFIGNHGPPHLRPVGKLLEGAIGQGVRSGQGLQRGASQAARRGAQAAQQQRPVWAREGRNLMGASAGGARGQIPRMSAAGKAAGLSGSKGAGSTKGGWSSVGRGLAAAKVAGVRAQRGKAQSAGRTVGSSGQRGAQGTKGAWNKTGRTLAGAKVSGVVSVRSKSQSGGKTVGSAGQKGAAGTKSGWGSVGRNLVSALAGAISDGAAAVIRAAVDIARAAIRAAKNALGIRSPSKRFLTIGRQTAAGMAKGIRRGTPAAMRAAQNMARATAKAAARSVDAGKWWDKYQSPYGKTVPGPPPGWHGGFPGGRGMTRAEDGSWVSKRYNGRRRTRGGGGGGGGTKKRYPIDRQNAARSPLAGLGGNARTLVRRLLAQRAAMAQAMRSVLGRVTAAWREHLELVGTRSAARSSAISNTLAQLVPQLAGGLVRPAAAASAGARAPAAAAPGVHIAELNLKIATPNGALPDSRMVVAQISDEFRNRGWTG